MTKEETGSGLGDGKTINSTGEMSEGCEDFLDFESYNKGKAVLE